MEEFKKYRESSLAEQYGVKDLGDEVLSVDAIDLSDDNTATEIPVKEIRGIKIPSTLKEEIGQTLNERLGD